MPHDTPAAFAHRLAADLVRASRGSVVGCYLHGSAALGGWNAARSDVDLLVLAADWSPSTTRTVTETLADAATDCPGTGLECSVVTAEAARHPATPWPFLCHVASEGAEVTVVDGATLPGDRDLLMHYAVTREHGIAVHGGEPEEAFGEIGRSEILAYLHDELEWALANASEAYAVLNALRAMRYARTGELVSKVSAGRAALEDVSLPAGLVARALAAQDAEEGHVAAGAQTAVLVSRAQALLETSPRRPSA